MATPWFKLWGGEYLADPKMDAFDGNERSVWLSILCLASQSDAGWILYSSEEKLLERSGVRMTDRERYRGILDKFAQYTMIEYCNGDVTQGLRPCNWEKRQYSESYERVKRYRKKNSNDDVTKKIRLDEEEDKNREDKRYIRFAKPTLEEIKNYCTERGNLIDPETFFDYYESKGWKVGQTPMKDWKASVRTWERKERTSSSPPQVYKSKIPAKK